MKAAFKYFGITVKYVLIWLLLTVAAVVVVYFVGFMAMASTGVSIDDFEKAAMNPWLLSVALLTADVICLLVFWKRKYTRNWIKYGYSYAKELSSKKLALYCVIGAVGCLALSLVAQEYMPIPVDEDTIEMLGLLLSNPVGIVSACLIGPLAEEAIFRGAIERRLLELKWNPWFAIVATALVFAAVHGNYQQGTTAFIIGCFMGWVYYRTRSIWPCFLIHAVNNTAAVALGYALPQTMNDTMGLSVTVGIATLLSGLLIIALSAREIGKMTNDRTPIPEPTDVEQPWPLNDQVLADNAPAAHSEMATPPDYNPQDS